MEVTENAKYVYDPRPESWSHPHETNEQACVVDASIVFDVREGYAVKHNVYAIINRCVKELWRRTGRRAFDEIRTVFMLQTRAHEYPRSCFQGSPRRIDCSRSCTHTYGNINRNVCIETDCGDATIKLKIVLRNRFRKYVCKAKFSGNERERPASAPTEIAQRLKRFRYASETITCVPTAVMWAPMHNSPAVTY